MIDVLKLEYGGWDGIRKRYKVKEEREGGYFTHLFVTLDEAMGFLRTGEKEDDHTN